MRCIWQRIVHCSCERVIAPLKSGFTNTLPLTFLLWATSSFSSHTLNPRNLLSVLRDLLDTYLYPPHPLLHDMDVGHIYTASNHFWSSMLYGHKPSSLPVSAAVSRIPNSWHHQCQNRHVCVLGHEMPQSKEGTVDILTMHNAGPRLFLCIVTSYARWNVSQSVIICDLCQKCHTSKITVCSEAKAKKYCVFNGINIHGREVIIIRTERSLSDWLCLNSTKMSPQFAQFLLQKQCWHTMSLGVWGTVLHLPPSHTCDVLAITGAPYMAIPWLRAMYMIALSRLENAR